MRHTGPGAGALWWGSVIGGAPGVCARADAARGGAGQAASAGEKTCGRGMVIGTCVSYTGSTDSICVSLQFNDQDYSWGEVSPAGCSNDLMRYSASGGKDSGEEGRSFRVVQELHGEGQLCKIASGADCAEF